MIESSRVEALELPFGGRCVSRQRVALDLERSIERARQKGASIIARQHARAADRLIAFWDDGPAGGMGRSVAGA